MNNTFITLEEFLLLQAPYEKLPLFSRQHKSGIDYVKHYNLSKRAFELDGQNGADKWEVGKKVISIIEPNCGRVLYFGGSFKQDERFYICNKSNQLEEHGVLFDKYYWWALMVPSELIPDWAENKEEFKRVCWW